MFDFQSAEFSTLGALLIDSSCLEQVRPVLPNGEAFGNPACRKAYEAICAHAAKYRQRLKELEEAAEKK